MSHSQTIWIYEIRNTKTGQVYIGRARGRSACYRWAEHVTAAGRGAKECPLLYAAMRETDITDWTFRHVEKTNGHAAARHAEAKYVIAAPPGKRLNAEGSVTVSADRRARVKELIKAGWKGVEIAAEVGISTSEVSKIRSGQRS